MPNRRPTVRKWLATYFGFSRSELNGVCVLAIVLLLLWAVPRLFSLRSEAPAGDLSGRIDEIDRFLAAASERTSSPGHHGYGADNRPETAILEVAYFTFDPNGLPVADWKRLGLSDRQIRMIKNYEAKGGRFRKKEDLAKIYAINDADYARLEPYVEIRRVELASEQASPADSTWASQPVTLPTEERALHLDLNAADSLELQFLPGIGPVFASRIVRYRELLGGFYQASQLIDVYGFDSVRFAGLEAHIYVDTSSVKKIALNTADYQRFRDHPYIDHKLANAIVQYRKQHGPYRAINDLLRIAIMDEQIFLKIAPYLTLTDD